MVTPEGDVQNRILFTERDYTAAELHEAANYINQNYSGQSFEDVRARLQGELRELRQDLITLMSTALDAGSRALAETGDYVISGERNLLTVQDLSQDVTRLKQLLELFERKSSLLQILDHSLRGQACRSSSAASPASPRPTRSPWSPSPTASTAKSSAPWG